jgi:hypothetical protein
LNLTSRIKMASASEKQADPLISTFSWSISINFLIYQCLFLIHLCEFLDLSTTRSQNYTINLHNKQNLLQFLL